MTFSVFLASEDQLQLGPLGKAIADFKGVPAPDAAHDAHECWGIVGENMEEAAALRLASCLKQMGLQSIVLPSEKLTPFPATVMLTHAGVSSEGLTGLDESRREQRVGWNSVRVIAAACLKTTTSKTVTEKQGPTIAQKAVSIGIMMATGLPIPIGPKKQTVTRTVSATDTFFMLDVVTTEPAGHYRILADNFNYSLLKERKQMNSMGNFKTVLSDAVTYAPRARRGKGTRILLAGQPVNMMGYDSERDLDRECRWLFSLPPV